VTLGFGDHTLEAVVFDIDDVLVPFLSVRSWQWAWRPQGPVLGERRTQTALRRSARAWDRRRWLGLTGKAPPADVPALREHLGATLRAVAGHAVPPEESEAVVRRMLHPAGEVERFPDVGPALERLGRTGVKLAALTPLPEESASWLLRRSGLPNLPLLGAGDRAGPSVPSREAFRSAADALGLPPERVAFVGDLYWSDVHAAQRAGLVGLLLDRAGLWPHLRAGRIVTLADVEGALASAGEPAAPVGGPSGAGAGAGAGSSGDFL